MQFPSRFLIFLHSLDKPQLEEKQKTLQSLPVRSVTILISQKVPDPACGFFICLPNKIQDQSSMCWSPQTIQEISETGKTEAKKKGFKTAYNTGGGEKDVIRNC